jgi:hypothetical protein
LQRGETLKQFIQFDEHLRDKIIHLENSCEEVSKSLLTQFQPVFENYGQRLIVELVRSKKGRESSRDELFDEDYESFIEIGIESDGEYFPNGYIPLWKCKSEWFEKIGYMTRRSAETIKEQIEAIVIEMHEEIEDSERD